MKDISGNNCSILHNVLSTNIIVSFIGTCFKKASFEETIALTILIPNELDHDSYPESI